MNHVVIAAEFGISELQAVKLIQDACDRLDAKDDGRRFIKKRAEIIKQIPAYAKGEADYVGSAEARTRLETEGREFIYVGKDLLGAIRGVASDQNLKGGHALGKSIPENVEIAGDLKELLQGL